MPDALIDKILAELGDIGYANRLSLYNNNEPFLDKRIVDIVGRARKRLPRAYLEIKSNGTVLTAAKVLDAFNAGLDMLYVNDYVEDGAASPKIDALRRELRHLPRFAQRLAIATRQVDAVLNTRAGTAPNRITLRQPLTVPCFRPFEMMTVNPAGVVAVCSDDVYFRGSMGNVNDQTLMEIWHSDRWQEMRARLLRGERAGYGETCRDCDNCNPKTDMMVAVGVPVPRPPWHQRARAVLRGSRDQLLARDAGSPVD
jgi:radical SAM protein with 4Fe4S-binding SPASM domain